jgi:AAA+ superfamily predicted ATPase
MFVRMAADDPLLNSLRAAVEAAPGDTTLRLHFAELLASRGERSEAVRNAAVVLQSQPDNETALRIVTGVPAPGIDAASGSETPPPVTGTSLTASEEEDLRRLAEGLEDVFPPMFVDDQPVEQPVPDVERAGLRHDGLELGDVESSGLRLADVGGMADVKARLEAAFLAPLRNPDLRRLYQKSLSGGLLLYGPPGCGKTFIARAVAGEMGASFLAISLADVLDMWIGQSERNIHQVFETARSSAPCVIFFDEVDALGQKRSHLRYSAARGTVNQLLSEMDGVATSNDGVYMLGATNHPWDVDVALRRPGRFDRMVLVLPPDQEARQAILRFHLRSRPVARVDLGRLAKMTDGYSGADLAFVCESAAERALLDSARSGTVRMIGMDDLERAVRDVKPSIGAWLESAKNVAEFANPDGTYDDLLVYLRKRRLA